MSAASPAQSQVRRNVAAAPPRPQQPIRQAAHAAPQTFDFSAGDEEQFRLNLSDIPRVRATVDVEVFKPSILSRLLDLVAPLDKR